jgi:diguanylate cyclase (GGDEF)-like protein
MWNELIENGHWSGEVWNRRKNGEEYAQMLTLSCIRDHKGIVQQYLGLFSDITKRRLIEDQGHELAFDDPLTHLPNRRLLFDRLTQVMASSGRSKRYCALMYTDLDNFKAVNDAHGHSVGDQLLLEVAIRLKACVREVDTVARFGGDEFVILLGELGLELAGSTAEALAIAEKIRSKLGAPYQLNFPFQSGQSAAVLEHRCSVSIGVVMFLNNESSADNIINRADAAMYGAKSSGRNAIRFHGMDEGLSKT